MILHWIRILKLLEHKGSAMTRKQIIIGSIILIALVVLVLGALQLRQHIQLQETISLEQERVNSIRRAVFAIGGEYTIWVDDDGFPHIEYTLETNSAIINLAGIERVHGLTPEETIALMTQERAVGRENVRNFLDNTGLHETRYDFHRALNIAQNDLYDNNVAGIPNPAYTPNLTGLPFHVLQKIIDHEAAIDALGGAR